MFMYHTCMYNGVFTVILGNVQKGTVHNCMKTMHLRDGWMVFEGLGFLMVSNYF